MSLVKRMLSREWIVATLLVIAGAALCVRLGIWQLDRLEQRRAFNAQVTSMRAMSPLDLNADPSADLTAMEYRAVHASGTYDFDNQVALRNQYYDGRYGFHLLTPLLLPDGRAVLVDRGWIPSEGNETPEGWSRYATASPAEVRGVMRLGQDSPDLGGVPDPTLTPGQVRLDVWNFVNIQRIESQVSYDLLPVYIQLDVDPGDADPPIPYQPIIELTEGPHFGYALQWFTFAVILLAGYPFFVRSQKPELTAQ